jgi:hypothetical protein
MMSHWKRRCLIRFVAGMFGYACLLAISMIVIKNTEADHTSRMLMVLLPVIPLLLVVSALIQNFQEMDELWRKIIAESFLTTAIITALSTFSIGLLQVNGLMPKVLMIYVLPYMCGMWGLSLMFVSRKYR